MIILAIQFTAVHGNIVIAINNDYNHKLLGRI